jgi:hypothetical protein
MGHVSPLIWLLFFGSLGKLVAWAYLIDHKNWKAIPSFSPLPILFELLNPYCNVWVVLQTANGPVLPKKPSSNFNSLMPIYQNSEVQSYKTHRIAIICLYVKVESRWHIASGTFCSGIKGRLKVIHLITFTYCDQNLQDKSNFHHPSHFSNCRGEFWNLEIPMESRRIEISR